MDRYVSIGEAAQILGVSVSTLRRWDREGKISSVRTSGNQRRYDLRSIQPRNARQIIDKRATIAYARVSSHDQKDDLERQKQVLELYCAAQGWPFEIISDLGSGMNYHKKSLKRLIADILDNKTGRLVLTHKDRLLRFGAELIFALCEARSVEVVILNQGEDRRYVF